VTGRLASLKLKRRIIKASTPRGRFLFISIHERPQVAVHSATSLLFFVSSREKKREREVKEAYTTVGRDDIRREIYARKFFVKKSLMKIPWKMPRKHSIVHV